MIINKSSVRRSLRKAGAARGLRITQVSHEMLCRIDRAAHEAIMREIACVPRGARRA